MSLAKLLLILFLMSLLPETSAAIYTEKHKTPRSYGYVIGDKFKHYFSITLDKPWTLNPNSLPKKGRINHWLKLSNLEIRENKSSAKTRYDIEISYQIFNAAEKTVEITTPQIRLDIRNKEQIIPIFIQEWRFSVSPLTIDHSHESKDYLKLQPPIKPSRQPIWPWYATLVLAISGLLISMSMLLYYFYNLPGFRRSNGPFARALKQIKPLQKQQGIHSSYASALRKLHHAFNETAGYVLLSSDLDQFFLMHPSFQSLRTPIEQVFHRSHRLFFDSNISPKENNINTLIQLCRQCRDIERGML